MAASSPRIRLLMVFGIGLMVMGSGVAMTRDTEDAFSAFPSFSFDLQRQAAIPPVSRPEPPARVESGRVILSSRSAERLGIQTAPVREERPVRKRRVGGEIMVLPPEPATGVSTVLVRVRLIASDMKLVDRVKPAVVLPSTSGGASVSARPVDALATGQDPAEAAGALFYALDAVQQGLVSGQRVIVEVPLSGGGSPRKVIPYGAVIYGLRGEAWTFTRVEPLVFVRQPIAIDYFEGDLAVLSDGPAPGTAVVTVGAAELFGIETGIGK